MHADISQALANHPKKLNIAWVDLYQWQLFTSDARPAVRYMHEKMAEYGFSHVIYYFDEHSLSKPVLQQLWSNLSVAVSFYTDLEQSLAGLAPLLPASEQANVLNAIREQAEADWAFSV